jgi:RNA polymerase sigma factor (sigma-70 family)
LVAGLEQHALTKKTASNRGRQYRLLADADLITLVEDDDPEALATLYERHGRAAYSVAYRMAGERQGAEDLVQEAFLEAWRAAGSYRTEKGSVKTWVLSIVRNRGIDLLRSFASRHRIQAAALTSQPGGAFVETWHDSQREADQGSSVPPATGSARGAGACVLLRVHPRGDSGSLEPAARYCKGPREVEPQEGQGTTLGARRRR